MPPAQRPSPVSRLSGVLRSWFDNDTPGSNKTGLARLLRVLPFLSLHLACFAVLWVGWSWTAVGVCIGLYLLRAFFVTAFYHRYFSHRTFHTSRPAQLVFAVLGNSAVQRGPLWWAAHHRQHHRRSDQAGDPHSPHEHSLYWSHFGWITSGENFPVNLKLVPDLARFGELRWLDRFDAVVPVILAVLMFGLGALLESVAPGLGTNGPQMLVWGFFVSTVILFHVTSLVNSAAHLMGSRRFETTDQSRNNLLIAILALGEGWHNNHHYYPSATRQGFYWWEFDPTWYGLKLLEKLGIIWSLQPVPQRVYDAAGRPAA